MSEMYLPKQLTIDYETYRVFTVFCDLCAKGYLVKRVEDHGSKIGLLTIYFEKSKELEDVSAV